MEDFAPERFLSLLYGMSKCGASTSPLLGARNPACPCSGLDLSQNYLTTLNIIFPLFCAQVPHGYALPESPLLLEAKVVRGFGRGSRQLGFPTANMDPVPLQETLKSRPLGVYFGCALAGQPSRMPWLFGKHALMSSRTRDSESA